MLGSVTFEEATLAAFAVLFLGLAMLIAAKSLDKSDRLSPAEVPCAADAVELAYLVGGPAHVIRLTLFDLVRRGLLSTTGPESFLPSTPAPETGLSEIERLVLQACPCSTGRIIGTQSSKVDRLCKAIRGRLESENLMHTGMGRTLFAYRDAFTVVGIAILWALLFAASNGATSENSLLNNLGFIIVPGAMAIALFAASSVESLSLTKRGRKYLADLSIAYGADTAETEERRRVRAVLTCFADLDEIDPGFETAFNLGRVKRPSYWGKCGNCSDCSG